MNERPELQQEARRWVAKAEHDLRNAEYVLGMPRGCPTDTVCFHCQQAAEKYLKALLISRGIDFPRTHDLVLLRGRAEETGELTLRLEELQPLNRYSVEARYPGDWEPIELHEATEALAMARGVRDAVRALLPPAALPEGDCS